MSCYSYSRGQSQPARGAYYGRGVHSVIWVQFYYENQMIICILIGSAFFCHIYKYSVLSRFQSTRLMSRKLRFLVFLPNIIFFYIACIKGNRNISTFSIITCLSTRVHESNCRRFCWSYLNIQLMKNRKRLQTATMPGSKSFVLSVALY